MRNTLLPVILLFLAGAATVLVIYVVNSGLLWGSVEGSMYVSSMRDSLGVGDEIGAAVVYGVLVAGVLLAVIIGYMGENLWLSIIGFLKTMFIYYGIVNILLYLIAWISHNTFPIFVSMINIAAFIIIIILLTRRLPPAAVSLRLISDTGKASIDHAKRIISIGDPHSSIVVVVKGDGRAVTVKTDPDTMFHISGPSMRGGSYEYSIVPLENGEGSLYIYRGRTLVLEYKVIVHGLEKRRFRVEVYFNDRKIGEAPVSVEVNKSLEEAIAPVVAAMLRKIGIGEDMEDYVKEILVFDEEDKILSVNVPIKKLNISGDTLKVMIYGTDELSELLRRFGEESIEVLWERLMKRLEALSMNASGLAESLRSLVGAIENNAARWW